MIDRRGNMMSYAIHLADLLILQRDDPIIGAIIAQHIGHEPITLPGSHFDKVALPFTCGAEQAGAIIALLHTKYRKAQMRCYQKGARGGWKRV